MDFLKPYTLALKIGAAIALVVVLIACYIAFCEHERGIGRTEIQTAWDHANTVALAARATRIAEAHKAEASLQAGAEKDRRTQNAKAQALAARVQQLTSELRSRPERPAATDVADLHQPTPGPGSPSWSTGAGLYRDDALFLVGKFGLCESIRQQRDDYFAQYQRAQAALAAQGQKP